jgi:hypothetical protein
MLPQEFKNSPTLFREALVADLSTFPKENPSCALLHTEMICSWQATIERHAGKEMKALLA